MIDLVQMLFLCFCLFLTIFPLAAIMYVIYVYNKAVSLKTQVEETWKQIDVRLQNRYDLLPDLIQAVEKAVSTDYEIYTKVAELRSAMTHFKNVEQSNNISEKIKSELLLDNAIRSLQITFEAYPELKSQDAIKQFMSENSVIEEKIAAARQIYNSISRQYNEFVSVFPNNIVIKFLKIEKSTPYFESSGDANKDIKPDWGGKYIQS